MDLTEEEVREILRLVEESSFDYLQINAGELNISIAKGGQVPQPWNQPAAQGAPAPAPVAPQAAAPAPPPQGAPAAPAAPAAKAGPRTYGPAIVPVEAPMVGTFYAAPDPESPPFVEAGAKVAPDTTVGLIEVMKVFTAVSAGVSGVITEMCVQDAELIEYGQVLFRVRPDGAASDASSADAKGA